MTARSPVPTCRRARWEAAVARAPVEPDHGYRRGTPRHDVASGTVRLACEQNGKGVVATGRLLNASVDGLMLRLHKPLPAGTTAVMQVLLGNKTFTLVGHVAHCTQTVGGYKLGVELEFAAG